MSHFDLFLFASDPGLVSDAAEAGMDGFVIDWEQRGKRDRQAGAGTEINRDTPDDLRRVRAATGGRLICRLNQLGPWSEDEVEAAVDAGADELLLPMVRAPEDVAAVLALAAGRCGVGILIETDEAVACAPELDAQPVTRVFLGLNDLSIARGSDSIFDAVADGTVERVLGDLRSPYGFAGLTLPDRGSPVPCRLLLAEMERLGCSFAFLRRSYRRDVPAHASHPEALAAIRAALQAARDRAPGERALAREQLAAAIAAASAAQIPR